MFCAQCGTSNKDSDRFCARCGAGLGQNAAAAAAQPSAAVLAAGGVGATAAAPGLRRDGDRLVVGRGATLPPYCVKCGQPADKFVKKNFGWHSPWLYLLIFAGVLVYAILATVLMKRMKIDVPLCEAHRKRRFTLLAAGWALFLGAIPLGIFIGSLGSDDSAVGIGFLVGFTAFIASMVLFAMGSRIMAPKKIDDNEAIFGGVSPAFLDYIATQPAAAATAASR